MTRLCVSIFVRDLDTARRDIGRALEAGADLVELRLDVVDSVQVVDLLRAAYPTARFVLTRRARRQGGECDEPDDVRLAFLREARGESSDYLDLELDASFDLTDAQVMQSDHDFATRPADLTQRLLAMQQGRAEVAKLAWTARSVRDNAEAFEVMSQGPKPSIAICMGEAGQISRILAKKFGAFLSFASLDATSATAPGQVTVGQLKSLYRWDAITRQTRVYGVVGSPVAHSMSPAIHNAGFDAVGFDGVYVPFLVEPGYESFKAFMETYLALAGMHLSGLSVTIPHKENALRYAIEKGWQVDDLARRIGALNTLVLPTTSLAPQPGTQAPGRAFSTDYDAILDTVTASLSIERRQLAGRHVVVLGAGGTGRTAVAAFTSCGATVTVANRSLDRARALAEEFDSPAARVDAISLDAIASPRADVYFNTTSLGMSPEVSSSPFDVAMPALSPETLVFDAVYNPLETKLIRQARDAGAVVARGDEMFLRQAAGQFEAFTGHAAPLEVMRRVIHQRLEAKL